MRIINYDGLVYFPVVEDFIINGLFYCNGATQDTL